MHRNFRIGTLAAEIQRTALDQLPYLPAGQRFFKTAMQRTITDVVGGQWVFWNVRRN